VPSGTPPTQMYVETSASGMVNAKASFESIDVPNLNIDNNVDSDMIFMSDCTQSIVGTSGACSAAPTYTTSSVSSSALAGVGDSFTAYAQGGYQSNGRMVTGALAVCSDNATPCTTVSATESVYTVTEIT
jgi:hypothetical protein